MIKEIYLAGGCFWGVEKYLSLIDGVVETETGYANGNTANPTYEDVCRRGTGHAETVRVRYDTDIIDLAFLLDQYYEIINPTSLNRQGGDVGTQYRTGIYYIDEADIAIIEDSLANLQKKHSEDLAIEALPLSNYYPAEEYHQNYLAKNPGGYCHVGAAEFAKAAKAKKS